MPSARIDFVAQSVTIPGKKQRWPADWSHDIKKLGMGMVEIRIPRPTNITAEDLAKASIWSRKV